tara:strand:+ start:6592 stop:7446 length:855 start_codon:yes stop_codon:yes gene_type:complete
MSEVLDSQDGQADADVAAPDGFDLAADLIETDGSVDSPEEPSAPENGPSPTQEIDLDTLDPSTLPEEHQSLAKQLQADYTRKRQADAQAANERTARLDQLEQRLNERVDLLAKGEQPQNSDPLSDLRSRLNEEESRAIDVIDQIDQARNGQFREETSKKFDQMTQIIHRLVKMNLSQMGQQAQAEADDLRQQYPDIDRFKPQTDALMGVENPATGQRYTRAEAYRTLTGLAAAESKQLDQQDQKARRQPNVQRPANVIAAADGAAINDSELSAAMQSLGFGPSA